MKLFKKLLSIQPEYCDIEADTDLSFFDEVASAFPKMKIIGSFHDFDGMPPDLDEAFKKMDRPHIFSYKMAVTAHTANDVLKLMIFARKHEKMTCIALGEIGQISRILAPILGSDFCYGSIDSEEMGQLKLSTLCDVYRFKQMTPDWKIYSLLGDPVTRSIGHLFHNEKFPLGAVYVKERVAIPDLPLFFSLVRELPFCGFSVTMPLKEQMEPFLTRMDPISVAVGSINTILLQDSHLMGYNTDGEGAIDALELHRPVKGLQVAILGAGGSARAIAQAAIGRGAKVISLNRTLKRAEALAKDFHCESAPLEEFSTIRYDVLVNTIPVDLVYDPKSIHKNAVVMDIVYWEDETSLLRAARERGCVCIHGREMFVRQALRQQKIWFGA